MVEIPLGYLKDKIKEVLSSGLSVVVIGWIDSNHSDFTRSIPKSMVSFFETKPSSISKKVGFVLFTRFMTHKTYHNVKNGNCVWATPLGVGVIKDILFSCEDVFASKKETLEVQACVEDEPDTRMSEADFALLDFLTQPNKENVEMDATEIFAEAFLRKANKDGLVSSFDLSKIISEVKLDKTPKQLMRDGVIDPVKSEGKERVGWYKAGKNMVLESKKEEPKIPSTPSERLEFLISQEFSLSAQKQELQVRIAEIDKSLQMIQTAKGLIGDLDSLFEKLKQK